MSAAHTYHFIAGSTRNILMGCGLAYSIQQEKYHHIPLIVIFPSVYAGYHAFNQRDHIASWIREKTIGDK
jgi:hypothetical protein